MPIGLEVADVRVEKRTPEPETVTTTYREPDEADAQIYARVLFESLREGRKPLQPEWLMGTSSGTLPIIDDLEIELRLLAEGARALAAEDLALAEADLPATREVLPPE